MASSPLLIRVATELAEELGPPHTAYDSYDFAVALGGDVRVERVDAAVFTSPSPSVATAACALVSARNGHAASQVIEWASFFGSPLVVIEEDASLKAYQVQAPGVAQRIDETPTTNATEWVRRSLAPATTAAQLELPLADSRNLIISETRRGLATLMGDLIAKLREAGAAANGAAFDLAIKALRSELFAEAPVSSDVAALIQPHASALRFPHLPLEAVAELYETLGLEARDRRDLGIAYTPAWVADYLVARLQADWVAGLRATDPTCGSGAFLVAFLEKVVTERSRRRLATDPSSLVSAVSGMDIDPVALSTTRLTLDLFARRLNLPPLDWDLRLGDATTETLPGNALIGNLPFGYRSHQGLDDVSSVILHRWLEDQPDLEHLALLLPDSFPYAERSAKARASLRARFRIDELIELPEGVFDRTAAATLGLIASRADDHYGAPVVRRIRRPDLAPFRSTGVPSATFVAKLPTAPTDPWIIAPFYRLIDRAGQQARARLADVAEIRLGLQAYGVEEQAITDSRERGAHPLLERPAQFIGDAFDSSRHLRRIRAGAQLRRTGPTDLYAEPKALIRATTNRHQVARLAALPDMRGLWFTDKFIGIWPQGSGVSVQALAAYLQTAFCECWVNTMNSSRKLRVSVLGQLPIPHLPDRAWERAAQLAPANCTVIAPRWRGGQASLLSEERDRGEEWEWFERTVALALGVSSSELVAIEEYLQRELTVGRPAR